MVLSLRTIVFSILFLFQLPLAAQKLSVSGHVTNASNNEPLPNASIVIKNTQTGAVSNHLGVFHIDARPNDVLIVSMIGYQTASVPVNRRTQIEIALTPGTDALDEIVLVGSRSGGRSRIKTPVPVDVINVQDTRLESAKMDMTSLLNTMVPSLNYNKQSGSDGADHVDIATLRGLSPDQTLVLVNGKRRHPTSLVQLFGTRGTGSSGTDLNAIPVNAIDRVEVLRDGASAQYGSDAIAGVINLILKKGVGKINVDAGVAGYLDPKFNTAYAKGLSANQYVSGSKIDGQSFALNADGGIAVGKRGGFLHLSGDFVTQGKTFRQVLKSDDLANTYWSLPINKGRRANGNGSYNNIGGFFNLGLPIGTGNTNFYAFGGYNFKKTDDYAYTRSFSTRPDRFPTTPGGAFIPVPGIIRVTSGPGGTDTVYDPRLQTHISDASLSAGINGTTGNGWNWDFSNTTGNNNFHFYGNKTFNASLGADKTHFDDGGFNFLQNTVNFNISKPIKGVCEGFNLAFGAEYRYEQYKLSAGEPDAYLNYDPTFAKDGGAQGFPGYQPDDKIKKDRSDIAGYVDAEIDVTDKWLVNAAIRAENYSDFGFTSNYKLATRYTLARNFNIRGSVSTGFRAPSLQQMNFSSTLTAFMGGQLIDIKISPNYSPITRAAGIPELKQEKSANASLGFAWKPSGDLFVTVDGYYITVKDRIVLSGFFTAFDPTLDQALTEEMQHTGVAATQFFANAVNTTNKGIDVVVDYHKKLGKHSFKALLTGNIQEMKIDKVNVPEKLNDTKEHEFAFLSYNARSIVLASAPSSKLGLNLQYGVQKFNTGLQFTYFGKVKFAGNGVNAVYEFPMIPTDADPNKLVRSELVYGGKITTDYYASYAISKTATLYAGVDNIFNVHPDLGVIQSAKNWSYSTQSGGPWDAVQMGENGRRIFIKAAFNF